MRPRLCWTVLFSRFAICAANPQLPPDAAIVEETTNQVAINEAPTEEAADAELPIAATIFHGVPGPKNCRGRPMTVLNLPKPEGRLTTELCYDLPDTAGCAIFVAAKADGCEAKLFAEPACAMFMNVAVFQPDPRTVGGNWRSMSIQCGIEPPDEDSLGEPPLAGLITNQRPKGG